MKGVGSPGGSSLKTQGELVGAGPSKSSKNWQRDKSFQEREKLMLLKTFVAPPIFARFTSSPPAPPD